MFSITPIAELKLKEYLTGAKAGTGLRVKITAGGCAGYKHDMMWTEQEPNDKVISQNNVSVFIDAKSMLVLKNAQLDWQESITSSGFKLIIPEAKAACGCGASFDL